MLKQIEKKNVNSNILYINLIFYLKLKLGILADFEIIKFNEYWCSNNLFCNVNNNVLDATFY